MRTKTTLLAFTLALLMLCSGLSGCASFTVSNDVKSYTLNDYLTVSPLNWNPHTQNTAADSYIPTFAEMGFVDVTVADDGVSYMWIYEMATAIDDVTADFADKDKWSITEDEGRVFRITLNPDAVWENGDPINADTYMYSIKALLDPKMQNARADTYCRGVTAILNADRYVNSETPIYAAVVPAYSADEEPDYSYDITANTVYMNLTSYDMTLIDSYAISDLYTLSYINAVAYALLDAHTNAFGFVEINETTAAAARTVAAEFLSAFGLAFNENLYKEMLFSNTGAFCDSYDFANVGIFKTGEYELTYITAQKVQMSDFLTGMKTNWIVYEPLYEAGIDTSGDIVTTNYGTSADTYMSYGPYKLTSFEAGKQFAFEKNENWYGYSDRKHQGQYMATNIKFAIIPSHDTALQLFNEGKLDGVVLTDANVNTYRMSDCLLKMDYGYTYRYVFATDIAKLAALETGENDNKKVLSYDDFRKAVSLSIDRTAFVQQATPAYNPTYSLFSDAYYCNGRIYRNTDAAKQAVLDLYEIEYGEGKEYADIDAAYASVTGYDVEKARGLFQGVYEQAKKEGNYTDGQKITLNCMVSAATELTTDDLKQERLLNGFITEATAGTGFEGNISFAFKCGAFNRFEDVANGRIEMIRSAWGGNLDPYSMIRCYTEPDYMGGLLNIQESCGWNPSAEMLTLTIDFDGDGTAETEEQSLQDWAKLINGGILNEDGNTVESAITDPDTQLTILAALENAVLGAYRCIPFASETACQLHSQKIRHATNNYNVMYSYVDIRLLTFNYDDAAWEAYIAEQGGILCYE